MQGALAATHTSALHWPLEVTDVMGRGGFDVVLGSPPWERTKLQEKEFFAARDPEIATAAHKAARDLLIEVLRQPEPGTGKRQLFEEFETAKRVSEAASTFVRVPGDEGGRFPYTGSGDVNTYALVAELFSQLTAATGRVGEAASCLTGSGRRFDRGIPRRRAIDLMVRGGFGHVAERIRELRTRQREASRRARAGTPFSKNVRTIATLKGADARSPPVPVCADAAAGR